MARPVKEINKEQFDDFAGFCYNKQRRCYGSFYSKTTKWKVSKIFNSG